jgi:large subunit ribosomal protein L15
MVVKVKKRKKAGKQRGNTTHGRGARKKGKGKGHQGGWGMAGTGKRADHKKTLINKLYGNDYFGKQGITSKATRKKILKSINLRDIERNLDSFKNKKGEIELKKYKVLGEGELTSKITIIAEQFSKSALEKIEKAGGKAIALKKEERNTTEKKEEPKIESVKKLKNENIKGAAKK